ncbi:MAG: Urease accessory protein UreD [Chroococcopsis gigantea SAG 12.99]|jgi:urease accessory protein|nr:urease accessory protein UreD [Chlorogloea purpurea SAG 13.99]MDV3001821.1 Urease accessory protein UreD [Chroococcopsis gigantea SAG 12.99]
MWQGKLDLSYGYSGGRTSLNHNFSVAPLKVQRPFYPEGKAICHTVTLHTAGGIVGGDSLKQNIILQPDSQSLITTASAGKVYRTNGNKAINDLEINVGKGACLEWLPQETIIFNGADYEQNSRVNLAPDAQWLGWDITRLGRTARGEEFLQGLWRCHTEIYRDGQPLWIDRQFLQGSADIINSPHGLHRCAIVANLLYLGHRVSESTIAEIRLLAGQHVTEGEWGISQTLGDGVICRYRGNSTSEVRRYFVGVWHFLRQRLSGRDAIYPRVWPS